jgi:hypothetical protein
LRPAIIEKDYYVTEALRIIAAAAPDKIIFKGGTSLAKGWNLIQRFSEDIDIFLDPRAFKPALGKNGVDRELKRLRDAVDRMSRTFTLDANYTWTHETDNALNSYFVSDLQTSFGAGFAATMGPTDSFVNLGPGQMALTQVWPVIENAGFGDRVPVTRREGAAGVALTGDRIRDQAGH